MLQNTNTNTTLYYKVLQILLKYYSSTTLYYKVLLKYLCTTPVLPCTTKYFMIDPHHMWNVIYIAQSNKRQPPTSPNTAPATQSESHDWSRIAYETSFTMRRSTDITLQLPQILRLPRKMNLMIDPHHIWNVIYNARSNSQHPPTSPNTAPATQNESHDWSTSHMKRHLQCAEQQAAPSNLTK